MPASQWGEKHREQGDESAANRNEKVVRFMGLFFGEGEAQAAMLSIRCTRGGSVTEARRSQTNHIEIPARRLRYRDRASRRASQPASFAAIPLIHLPLFFSAT
jgi:hypothetical protein